LIREVEIDRDLCNELQERLRGAQPNNKSKDIPAIKREVLLKANISPNDVILCRNSSVPETMDDEEDPLQPLPAPLKYLDLSSLELRTSPKRFPSPMLIRDEYKLLDEKLEDLETSEPRWLGSIFITGQPGLGMLGNYR